MCAGRNGVLKVNVQTYEPNVRCLEPSRGVPSPEVCDAQALDLPPAWSPLVPQFSSRYILVWKRGKTLSNEEKIIVSRPWIFANHTNLCLAGLQCTITIAAFASGTYRISCDWGTIYHAVVAVMGMCVRRGLGGVARFSSTDRMLLIFRSRLLSEADFL